MGDLRQSVTRGLTVNAVSRSILGDKSSFLAQIEDEMKLHPVGPSKNQNLLFLGLYAQPKNME